MILARVLPGKPVRTSFGLEYQAQFSVTNHAKSMSGQVGPIIHSGELQPGDIVEAEYMRGTSYGLWFATGVLAHFDN